MFRVAIWNQVSGGDGEQEDAVQVRVDGRLWQRDVEEAGEERPPHEHRHADQGVVDA